ncbi:unnamed protein product [Microthlaspi erraticum]|uniref:Uncharacterized protein n=1 Tax=Microthlaspi erraticum TaxID=1685480 RepID=A0A6D2IBD1_9BRAS|nr:unnamed protein product [Microthlaspi erraticum]
MERDPRVPSPIKAIPLCHISLQRNFPTEQEISSPQAPPPSWESYNSPPSLSPLMTKKNLLLYLQAADLETSSQADFDREKHLLVTPISTLSLTSS